MDTKHNLIESKGSQDVTQTAYQLAQPSLSFLILCKLSLVCQPGFLLLELRVHTFSKLPKDLDNSGISKSSITVSQSYHLHHLGSPMDQPSKTPIVRAPHSARIFSSPQSAKTGESASSHADSMTPFMPAIKANTPNSQYPAVFFLFSSHSTSPFTTGK